MNTVLIFFLVSIPASLSYLLYRVSTRKRMCKYMIEQGTKPC